MLDDGHNTTSYLCCAFFAKAIIDGRYGVEILCGIRRDSGEESLIAPSPDEWGRWCDECRWAAALCEDGVVEDDDVVVVATVVSTMSPGLRCIYFAHLWKHI